MRKGEGILAGIIYPATWYRRKTRVGVTSRERRNSSVLALSHRPSRAATDSSCHRERTNEKKCVYVCMCPHVSLRVECIVTPAGRNPFRFTPFPVISDCQWSSLPLAKSRSIGCTRAGLGTSYQPLSFEANAGGEVIVVPLCRGGAPGTGSWRQRVPLEALRRQSRSIAARRCRKVKVSTAAAVQHHCARV